ncbi:MAG: VanZ family protein [Planctomycetota bacterium]
MYVLAAFVSLVSTWTLAANVGVAPRFARMLGGPGVGDKVIHFAVVGGFALVLAHALKSLGFHARRALLTGMAIAATLATLEEFSNLLTPYRSFSTLDLVADYAGVLTLGGGAWLASRLRLRRAVEAAIDAGAAEIAAARAVGG